MKLIRNDGSILVLRVRFPSGFALPFVLVLSIGGAVVLANVFPQVAILSCHRQTVTPICEIWRNNRDFRREIETIEIGSPQRALIQDSVDNDGNITYRVAVQGDLGTHPIVTYYSRSLSDKEQQQRQIEQFIADPRQSELIVSNVNWWIFPNDNLELIVLWGYADFIALFGLVFILTLILFRHTIYRFDHANNTFTVERTIFGLIQRKIYPLSEIRSVVLEESTESDDDGDESIVYRVRLYLSTGKRLGSTGFDSVNVEAKAQLVETLNDFLGL